MGSEKTEGLEVRGYEVRLPSRDEHGCPTTVPALRLTSPLDGRSPREVTPHYPLVRQVDALALAERAREEGRREGLREAARALEEQHSRRDCVGHHAEFRIGYEEAMDVVDALLTSQPPGGGPK